ncbi:MAG: type II secretion system F family protein [Candidatus Aenigmarchaeota archaeon]|nr:type II secretion system F family protein [Candidatus Aenigmarchaeota archaeon]
MASYNAISTVLFGGLVDKIGDDFKFLRESLPKTNIQIPFRSYLSAAIFSSLIIYLFSLVVVATVVTFLNLETVQKIIFILFGPFLLAGITFAVQVLYPYQRALSTSRNIDANLPFALSHMAAIAESGVPPYMIFKLLSRFDEYGEIAREMKVLVRNIDSFGIDPLTAIRELANKTPSDDFKQILLGIVSATEGGGDVKTYIKNAGQQALFEWKLKREKFMQQLDAYSEFYTGILITAPLFIISLFAVMNMIQPNIGGFDILTLTRLSIYVLVPLLNVGFLLFLRGVEVEM